MKAPSLSHVLSAAGLTVPQDVAAAGRRAVALWAQAQGLEATENTARTWLADRASSAFSADLAPQTESLTARALDPGTAPNAAFKAPKDWASGTRPVGEDGRVQLTTRPEAARGGMPTSLKGDDVVRVLRDAGLEPDDWDLEKYSCNRWDGWSVATGVVPLQSHRLTLIPSEKQRLGGVTLDDILDRLADFRLPEVLPTGDELFVITFADIQLGKVDGDGVEGQLRSCYESLELAVRQLAIFRAMGRQIGTILVAFLGDEGEGVVSQGGALRLRTGLTSLEQSRAIRRLKTDIVRRLAPLCSHLVMAAIPGNHDEDERIGKSQSTRPDSSWAVETTIAVADACKMVDEMTPEGHVKPFAHVEFFVPDRDRLTVTLELCGTRFTLAHGHQWSRGKHWEWLDAMSGNRQQAAGTDILLCGHHHHLKWEERGRRNFLQSPAHESESAWWLNKTGQGGHPGSLSFLAHDGIVEFVQPLRRTDFVTAA